MSKKKSQYFGKLPINVCETDKKETSWFFSMLIVLNDTLHIFGNLDSRWNVVVTYVMFV